MFTAQGGWRRINNPESCPFLFGKGLDHKYSRVDPGDSRRNVIKRGNLRSPLVYRFLLSTEDMKKGFLYNLFSDKGSKFLCLDNEYFSYHPPKRSFCWQREPSWNIQFNSAMRKTWFNHCFFKTDTTELLCG